MKMHPDEMRAAAGDLNRLGQDTGTVQERLHRSWGRLDHGWQSYERDNAEGRFREAMRELSRMEAMLRQMGEALGTAAELVETADREAAGLFSRSASGGGEGGAAVSRTTAPAPEARDRLPPGEEDPWEADGFGWWAQEFTMVHGRAPTEEDYRQFRFSWQLSGEGQVQWTDADWVAFYYAQEAGLEDWLALGLTSDGPVSGQDVLAAVEALNADPTRILEMALNLPEERSEEILHLLRGGLSPGFR